MSARTIRRVFAAPFVITIACGKSEPKDKPAPAPEPTRYFEISKPHIVNDGCVLRETCPPGTHCTPAAYAFPCEDDGTYQRIRNKQVPIPRTGPSAYPEEEDPSDFLDFFDVIAKLPDGTCRARAETCLSESCLGAPTPCPPAREVRIPAREWRVERTGTTCRAVPLPATVASTADPVVDYPCPEDPSVIGVRADYGKCRVDNDVGIPPRPILPGSTWNPPPPIDIECPSGYAYEVRPPRRR
jgi:hypothetical protein